MAAAAAGLGRKVRPPASTVRTPVGMVARRVAISLADARISASVARTLRTMALNESTRTAISSVAGMVTSESSSPPATRRVASATASNGSVKRRERKSPVQTVPKRRRRVMARKTRMVVEVTIPRASFISWNST